jgi:hypothetical protein
MINAQYSWALITPVYKNNKKIAIFMASQKAPSILTYIVCNVNKCSAANMDDSNSI